MPPTWLSRATTIPLNGARTEASRSPAAGSSSTIVPPIGMVTSCGIRTAAISCPAWTGCPTSKRAATIRPAFSEPTWIRSPVTWALSVTTK